MERGVYFYVTLIAGQRGPGTRVFFRQAHRDDTERQYPRKEAGAMDTGDREEDDDDNEAEEAPAEAAAAVMGAEVAGDAHMDAIGEAPAEDAEMDDITGAAAAQPPAAPAAPPAVPEALAPPSPEAPIDLSEHDKMQLMLLRLRKIFDQTQEPNDKPISLVDVIDEKKMSKLYVQEHQNQVCPLVSKQGRTSVGATGMQKGLLEFLTAGDTELNRIDVVWASYSPADNFIKADVFWEVEDSTAKTTNGIQRMRLAVDDFRSRFGRSAVLRQPKYAVIVLLAHRSVYEQQPSTYELEMQELHKSNVHVVFITDVARFSSAAEKLLELASLGVDTGMTLRSFLSQLQNTRMSPPV